MTNHLKKTYRNGQRFTPDATQNGPAKKAYRCFGPNGSGGEVNMRAFSCRKGNQRNK